MIGFKEIYHFGCYEISFLDVVWRVGKEVTQIFFISNHLRNFNKELQCAQFHSKLLGFQKTQENDAVHECFKKKSGLIDIK